MPTTIADLRSDTVTRPTPAMRTAMYQAEVGDDVLGEDPTVNRLEALGAERLGMEAALFVPSGTFGNECALFTHCARGSEVILSEQSHVVQHEAGGAAVIAGVQLRTVCLDPAGDGVLRWSDIEGRLRVGDDYHYPANGLIEYENATSGGRVASLEVMSEISAGASRRGVPVHLDGARVFNAATFLGVAPSELGRRVSSVMFCLSKGLCAPVGSLLAGSREFVALARRRRKILGGGMRQAGVIAACGIVALEQMTARLGEDHAKARRLGEAFRACSLDVAPWPTQINMLFVRYPGKPEAGARMASHLSALGVLNYGAENGWVRLVTHHDVSEEAVTEVCRRIPDAVEAAHR